MKKALSINPDSVPVLYDFARLAVKRKNYAEAAVRLQKVLTKDKLHTQSYYQLFLVYSRLKDDEKAQKMLAEFRRLDVIEKQSAKGKSRR